MGWIDRINERLIRFAHRHEPVRHVEADGVRLAFPDGTQKRYPFAALSGACAEIRDDFAANIVVLVLRFADGTPVEFAQDDPSWWTLTEGLDRSGCLARPSAEWQIEAIVASDKPGVIELM